MMTDTAARNEIVELRRRLRAAGYSPVPVEGKRPRGDGWQNKHDPSDEEIILWSKVFNHAVNTGILTRLVPVLDIDILQEEAAEAVEELVRDRFLEDGDILIRVGFPPKRAVPFRTDNPFKKTTINLISPNGSEGEKLELLCDGQQLAAFGIHPDTGKPYRWHGGEPGKIKRENLPYIHQEQAQQLVEDAVDLLVREYGYKRTVESRQNGANNGRAVAAPSAWRTLMMDGVGEGQRDNAATRLCGYLLRKKVGVVVVLEIMQLWNTAHCRPPLPPEDIQRICNSIAGKEKRRRFGDG
jgi:hypothetical protein